MLYLYKLRSLFYRTLL